MAYIKDISSNRFQFTDTFGGGFQTLIEGIEGLKNNAKTAILNVRPTVRALIPRAVPFIPVAGNKGRLSSTTEPSGKPYCGSQATAVPFCVANYPQRDVIKIVMGATPSQIPCPNCPQFKNYSISPKTIVRNFGLTSLFLGAWLAIFLIGIPFLIIGVVLVIISFFFKENGKRRCRACGFVFYDKK